MNNFKFIIPNKKATTYSVVTFIIALMNLVAFFYVRVNAVSVMIQNISLVGSALMFTAITLYLITKRENVISLVGVFFISGLLWCYLGLMMMGLLMLVFAIFGFIASRKLEIIVQNDGIRYPSFPSRVYPWNEISQVLLKDHVLTIDLLNNKLIQFSLPKESVDDIDENVFNDFCRQSIMNFIIN